jgi:RNA polymerase sigma factor (sigma-70 family)
LEEPELIHACLKGDLQAQKTLYERYKTTLFRMCLRYAKNKMEAEDFLQESFLAVFRDLAQYQAQGSPGAWIRRVALNAILQQLRKRDRKMSVNSIEMPPHPGPDMAENPFLEMDARELTGMIQLLPSGYRTVFNLFVVEGFSHQEIASMLGISESTSKSQLFKAKAKLREITRLHYPFLEEERK